MAILVDCLFLLLLKSTFLSLIAVKATSKLLYCDHGYFINATQSQCQKCSICPTNHIIHTPCSDFADVKCTYKHFSNFGSNFQYNSNSKKDRRNRLSNKSAENEKLKKAPPVNNGLTPVENEDYWRTLAFALIGLLSVLIIATFIILIFVYRRLQKSIVIKQSEEGELMDDADSGYVVIRAIHHLATPHGDNPIHSLYPRESTETHPPLLLSSGPTSVDSGRPADSISTSTQLPSEGKLCFFPKVYQPQRRLLNYDADDVFESDDNASINHASDPNKNYNH